MDGCTQGLRFSCFSSVKRNIICKGCMVLKSFSAHLFSLGDWKSVVNDFMICNVLSETHRRNSNLTLDIDYCSGKKTNGQFCVVAFLDKVRFEYIRKQRGAAGWGAGPLLECNINRNAKWKTSSWGELMSAVSIPKTASKALSSVVWWQAGQGRLTRRTARVSWVDFWVVWFEPEKVPYILVAGP